MHRVSLVHYNWPALASEEEDRCKMPPAAPLRRGGVILRRLLRRAGRGAERRGAPEGTRTSSLHPTYLRSAQSKMLLRKRGGRLAVLQSKAWAWQAWRGKQDDWRTRQLIGVGRLAREER